MFHFQTLAATRDRPYLGTEKPLPRVLKPQLFSVQPDSHTGLDPPGRADRIGADHEGIEIAVGNGMGGTPSSESTARDDLVDSGVNRRTAVGQHQLGRKADTQAIEVVLARIEAGPVLASLMQRQQRLTGDDRRARLRDQEGNSPICRRVDAQFGDPRGNHRNSRGGGFDLASTIARSSFVGPRRAAS